MILDTALDALARALAAAGVPRWEAPATTAELEALEAELAPMRLPQAVREFWTRVDVGSFRAQPYPAFTTPGFALESWRMARDDFPEFQPLALVNVGYESHGCMSVELDVDDFEGGALYEWAVDDPSGFTRRFDGLADWVAYVADLVAAGRYRRTEGPRGAWLFVPDPDEVAAEQRARPAQRRIGGDILEWPQHWQRANGVRPEHLRLRGATHTVAEVLASRPDSELRATIAARVVDLAGGAGWARASRIRSSTRPPR